MQQEKPPPLGGGTIRIPKHTQVAFSQSLYKHFRFSLPRCCPVPTANKLLYLFISLFGLKMFCRAFFYLLLIGGIRIDNQQGMDLCAFYKH